MYICQKPRMLIPLNANARNDKSKRPACRQDGLNAFSPAQMFCEINSRGGD